MYNFINNTNHMNNKQNNFKRISSSSIKPNNLIRGVPPSEDILAKTVSLFSQAYLDTYNQCYKNIVVINLKPQGPLKDLVRFVKFSQSSEFKDSGPCSPLKECGFALMSLDSCNKGCGKFGNDLMVVDEVPNLISYLISNGYTVDTSITKMFNTSDIRFNTNIGNKLICFVTYNG
jgi:hypothetical protein